MPTRTQTTSAFTFTSTSFSSSSDSAGNLSATATISNPSGTTIHRTTQVAGQPARTETVRLPAGARSQGGAEGSGGRIEDVTEADRKYEERVEDEYAKREGGA